MTVKLKRIAPGLYETRDGRYEVVGFQRPERCDYGPAGEWRWYYRPKTYRHYADVGEHFDTKREAVAALAHDMKLDEVAR